MVPAIRVTADGSRWISKAQLWPNRPEAARLIQCRSLRRVPSLNSKQGLLAGSAAAGRPRTTWQQRVGAARWAYRSCRRIDPGCGTSKKAMNGCTSTLAMTAFSRRMRGLVTRRPPMRRSMGGGGSKLLSRCRRGPACSLGASAPGRRSTRGVESSLYRWRRAESSWRRASRGVEAAGRSVPTCLPARLPTWRQPITASSMSLAGLAQGRPRAGTAQ